MADLSGITAVRPTADTISTRVTYGATIAAGQLLYLDSSDNEYKLALSDSGSATTTTANASGIAITPGVDGGYGYIATAGTVFLVGTTMAIGEQYMLSNTPGGIAPDADIGTGDYVTQCGVATTANLLRLGFYASGITHA